MEFSLILIQKSFPGKEANSNEVVTFVRELIRSLNLSIVTFEFFILYIWFLLVCKVFSEKDE